MAAHRRHPATVRAAVLLVLGWLGILGATAALVAGVLLPRLAGATPYAVLTSSMEPTLPPGTLVVARPVAPEQIGVGDVITFQLSSGRPLTATHRVTAVEQRLDGERSFVTKGDANATADPAVVRPVQVRGELWYAVPYLGHLHRWLSGSQRTTLTSVVAGGLSAYAAVMLGGAWRDRARVRPVSR
ncbi:signal peptidase I [Aeromicrobium sp. PE09-221]|uniref:signal peptidase I n=1 Tax=Aeromicrobium sp. PE09-221 TaxID=1898043 RepID=UPI000B3E8BCE|nr:signal peptidase I [Aeromicrobium sp. PE09-221]OUZ12572.1 signal peptidase I [Aeromicrobium sp. PE09-221]